MQADAALPSAGGHQQGIATRAYACLDEALSRMLSGRAEADDPDDLLRWTSEQLLAVPETRNVPAAALLKPFLRWRNEHLPGLAAEPPAARHERWRQRDAGPDAAPGLVIALENYGGRGGAEVSVAPLRADWRAVDDGQDGRGRDGTHGSGVAAAAAATQGASAAGAEETAVHAVGEGKGGKQGKKKGGKRRGAGVVHVPVDTKVMD